MAKAKPVSFRAHMIFHRLTWLLDPQAACVSRRLRECTNKWGEWRSLRKRERASFFPWVYNPELFKINQSTSQAFTGLWLVHSWVRLVKHCPLHPLPAPLPNTLGTCRVISAPGNISCALRIKECLLSVSPPEWVNKSECYSFLAKQTSLCSPVY